VHQEVQGPESPKTDDSNLDSYAAGRPWIWVGKTATLSSWFEYAMGVCGHQWSLRSTSLNPKVHRSIPCAGTTFSNLAIVKYYMLGL
jgi:hypothetical protein